MALLCDLESVNCSVAVHSSVAASIQRLVELNCKRVGSNVVYGQEQKTVKNRQQCLKRNIYDALFNRQLLQKYKKGSLSWQHISDLSWDTSLVTNAVAYRLRFKHRRFLDANKLVFLVDHLLIERNGIYEPVIQLLLCLCNIDANSLWNTIDGISLVDRVRRRQDKGEVENLQMLEHRRVFPMLKYPFMPLNSHAPPVVEPTHSIPRPMNILLEQSFTHSSLSEVFDTGLTEDNLFSGLVHSMASLNDKLSLPLLPTTKDIDLCRHLKAKSSNDEDEGFVSRGPSSPSSETSSKFLARDLQPFHDSLLDDDEPYIGYRKPDYNLLVWRDCLKVKLSKHRTWETIGKSAGCSEMRWYLSEAGFEVYDAVWKQRWGLAVELASALCPNSDAAPPHSWVMMDERSIVHHARLVAVGVASDTFNYNRLARMFLVTRDIHYKGITGVSARSLLSKFADWGTAYRRLLNFSSSIPSYVEGSSKDWGVIFKVLCDGVRTYLQEYQRSLLSQNTDGDTSLLRLHCAFKRAGSQISYLCRLCKCGNPSDAMDDANIVNFPTGIDILSYLYEEAVYCTEATDYLVLLYLLRQCCQPYLEFVQNWVFHGVCWDVGGEFLLRVNSDVGNRRDRQRWNDYVTVERPDDVTSCVPSFLAPVAEDLLLCGKTVEFLNLICPEHFLCTRLVKVPLLLMTFSKSRMRVLQKRWSTFQDTMEGLEESRRMKWMQKKADFAKSEMVRVAESHVAFAKQVEAAREANERLLKQVQQTKQVELERLRQQAEDGLKRRKLLRDAEREEDIRRLKEQENMQDVNRKKEELLEQEKQALVDRYDILCAEVGRRRERAEWKLKRHQLNQKRLKLLFQDEDLRGVGDHDDLPVKDVDGAAVDDELRATSDVNSDVSTTRGPENLIDHVTSSNTPYATSSQSTQPSNVAMGTRSLAHPSDESTENFQGRLLKPGLGRVSDESLPSEVRLSTTRGNQHVSQQSSEVLPVKSSRKNVANKHVSQSSLQFSEQTEADLANSDLLETPLLSPPSDDTMVDNMETTRTFRKSVFDRHVSQTTLQLTDNLPAVISRGSNIDPPSVALINVNNESCDDEKPIRTLRKVVGDHHVSDSQLTDIFSLDTSCSKVSIDPSSQLLQSVDTSKRLGHSSDSTMQHILYGHESQTPAVQKEASDIVPDRSNHPSRSRTCITTLLYPRDDKTDFSDNPNTIPEGPRFNLHLPKIGAYDDEVNFFKKAFKSERRDVNESLKFVDLLNFVNDTDVSDDEAQYDVASLLSGDDAATSIDLHTLPILLRNSVIQPIKQQSSLVNRCAIRYFMDDLDLPRHFEALRHFFLLEDGEFARTLSDDLFEMRLALGAQESKLMQKHNRVSKAAVRPTFVTLLARCLPRADSCLGRIRLKVHSDRRPVELFNPVCLDSILAHSIQSSTRRSSPLATYLSFQVKFLPLAFNPTDLQVLNCLELRYKVQWPINVIISESCHNKYNLMLSFLLQLKLVAWALQDIRARLNRIASDRSNVSRMTSSDVRKSHIFRHEMQNFVKVMQGYVSSQVLHVCWQEFNDDLKHNVTTLDQLHLCHAEYINKCILRCLLTPKAQNVMNIISDVLRSILRFRVQLATPSSANFSLLQRTYHEFSRLSNFLYKVVSKLVQRGYQPHLEDFLIRLNYNGFYKS